MAWSDMQGILNFDFFCDGRVEDDKERDGRRLENIMRNWDLDNLICKSTNHF
jgi:hypothetical protein